MSDFAYNGHLKTGSSTTDARGGGGGDYSRTMMTRDKSKPQILKQELVAQSRLFKVEALHLRFTNGTERIYERMQGGHRGAVMLVPLLDDETLLLVREYAAGTHSYELGFPKGVIDAGENAAQAGNRELMEETGERLPVIISGTVTDASGRILSGQTVGAFWNSVRHATPQSAPPIRQDRLQILGSAILRATPSVVNEPSKLWNAPVKIDSTG